MAVNLSPVAGAAAQFFDNSGNVLTGGKLYTYDAGTTTPAPTYTSSSGVTAQPNPIILNAAGRVPDSGEIWLADGVSYKFVLKDANDVLIGTYDNLVGINSNFVNFTGEEETQTATQGQTIFTLATLNYSPAVNNLLVFVNGSKQISGTNYQETSSTVITFVDGLNVGDVVDFCTATPINTAVVDASEVSYNQGGIGAVNTTVEAKLQEFISVKDFGAVGDGVTDDTVAVQDAVDYCLLNDVNLLVDGKCLLTASINIDREVNTPVENSWFVISGVLGGGFYTETAITLFDTTLDYTSAPQTSQIKFEDVVFESDVSSLAAYVISPGYLRTAFVGCSFKAIKLFQDTTTWSQSIYLDKCVARAWEGTFFNCSTQTYDLKVFQTYIEAPQSSGGNGFSIGTANGCAFTDNVIEGLFGFGIQYDGANGLQISGNYFENNTGYDIDGTPTGPSTFALGVNIVGNHFENTGTPSKTYCIGWSPYIYGGYSTGNGCAGGGTLHYLPTPDQGLITIANDGVGGGSITSNIPKKQFFTDRQYPAKGGYIYGASSDADAASLYLGTFYNSSTLLNVVEVSHLNQVNFNGATFKPANTNYISSGNTRGAMGIKNTEAGNSTDYLTFYNSANGSAGAISQTGATTVTYATSSDYRLKENIAPMSGALDKVLALKPVTYKWKKDGTDGQGFIAHELQAIVPECVVGEKDAVDAEGNPKYQGIDTSFLVATLVSAIQELKAEIDLLKAK